MTPFAETPSDQNDPHLDPWFESLRDVPPRNVQRAARARADFLAAAKVAAPVSAAPKRRLTHWKDTIRGIFRPQQERKPMMSTFGTILLIAALLMGGGGVTTAAAQAANPDELLYPVKVWSEETRYTLAGDDAARFELTLQFAERRMAEIQAQFEDGLVPPQSVQTRLQNQLELALNLAAALPPAEIPAALQRIQTILQNQLQIAQGWQSDDPAGQQVAQQVRTLLQERLQLCEQGLQDPTQLRERLRERQNPTTSPSATQGQGGAGNPWIDDTTTPGSGNGAGGSQNPWTDVTPTSGSGYGPGPNDSQNPWTTGTPTPGSGYGPGPNDGSNQTCTPGSGSGQQTSATAGNGGNKP